MYAPVSKKFLPTPRVVKKDDGSLYVERFNDSSFGSISAWLGNFTVYIKALAYILSLGRDALSMAGPLATLNANYVMHSLDDLYKLPIPGPCKHEFVFDGLKNKSTGVTTLNVAKRLLDFGSTPRRSISRCSSTSR